MRKDTERLLSLSEHIALTARDMHEELYGCEEDTARMAAHIVDWATEIHKELTLRKAEEMCEAMNAKIGPIGAR